MCFACVDYPGYQYITLFGDKLAAHGKLEQFHMGQDDWELYEERLQQYFVANDIKETEKKRAILLSSCGQSTYKVIRNLVAPRKPESVTTPPFLNI